MYSLNDASLECNNHLKINFNGGDISSDAGLLLLKEFSHRIGAETLVRSVFHTNDTTRGRLHRDDQNLWQAIYQIIAAYFQDDCADELTNDPVLTAVLGKESLASQPTLSRFHNRMDEDTLVQFNEIQRALRKTVYSIRMPEFVVFDLDSTLLPTCGKQEGSAFNFHYREKGYHPLLAYDALTGDLLKAELREGSTYCGKDADVFLNSLIREYITDFPGIQLFLRADSGFAQPALYDLCEANNCTYTIRLKENAVIRALADDRDQALYRATKRNQIDYAVEYGEFEYRAASWSHPRRVVFKVEKPYGQMVHQFTFLVTTSEMEPYQVIQFYCGRGRMENFIQEGKSGFHFSSVSSQSEVVNANRLQIHALAYNLFNWFRRLALPKHMRKLKIDTIRIKILKVAARVIHSARYTTFKLCSSCPYKKEFYETLNNIHSLRPQFE